MQVKAFRVDPEAKLPSRAHDDDACFDLFLTEDAILSATPRAFHTGIKLIIPRGYKVIFKEKSGKALKGVQIHGGVIDSGYTGELMVIASCHPGFYEKPPESSGYSNPIALSLPGPFLKKGEAICQFSIEEVLPADVVEIDETEFLEAEQMKVRKSSGFGSTGR